MHFYILYMNVVCKFRGCFCTSLIAGPFISLHSSSQVKHGLTDTEVAEGKEEFMARMEGRDHTPRQLLSVWLNLVRDRKNGRIPNWQKAELLVVTTGRSVDWTSIKDDLFPCILPTMKYTLLRRGSACDATSKLCLALQGVEDLEIEWLGISHHSSAKQKDFAGNMFTANVLTACWVAVALYL